MKKFILIAAGFLLMNTAVQAQTVKLGHINSQELLMAMPEMTKADTDIKSFAKVYQDQLETMAKEFDKKVQEYQVSEKTMADAVKEVKQKELQDLQKRIESTQVSAEEKVAKKREEIYKPILDKANNAIQAVAKEKGYTYIFENANGTVLYANDSDNVLPLVKAKLGLK